MSSRAAFAVATTLLASALSPATVQATGIATDEMTYCASLGAKHPGNDADRTMGDHILQRFTEAGLQTSTESFHLPVWKPRSSTLTLLGTQPLELPSESFAYSGTGNVAAPVVDLKGGRPEDYDAKDVRGRIVLVDSGLLHRTAQLKQIVAHGGVAMIYASASPQNLIQTGAVSFAVHPPASIPTVTIGKLDGQRLRERMTTGPVNARVSVQGDLVDAVGRNIIGLRKGTSDRNIVVAAHYDSWHAGAADNCTAVGSLLEMVARTTALHPTYNVYFIGWDAEEPGVVGSYWWLREHPEIVAKTVVDENLELTSIATFNDNGDKVSDASLLNLVGTTLTSPLPAVLAAAAAQGLYAPVLAPFTAARLVAGGLVATDVEGFYGLGVQGFTTAVSSPYYHTTKDVADTIGSDSLQAVTQFLLSALLDLQAVPPAAFDVAKEVPTITLSAPSTAPAGAEVAVDITVRAPTGLPLSGQPVVVLASQQDNWPLRETPATDLGGGRYRWTLPAGTTDADITNLRASITSTYTFAVGFGRIDQRAGGVLAGSARACLSRRRLSLHVRRLRRGERVVALRATASAGRVHVVRGRTPAVRLDLRGVRRSTVAVRLRIRTSRGRVLSQTRVFRTCARA